MTQTLQGIQPYLDVAIGISTGIYILGILWFATGMRANRSKVHQDLPFISVVVAARNEAERIGTCLDGLLAQGYPKDAYEIIVVDDGSTDDTARIVQTIAASNPSVMLLSTQEAYGWSGSLKAAHSLAIRHAHGEIIVTTDADCRVLPTWVQGMVDCFTDEVGMVVGFSQIGAPGEVDGLRMGWEASDFLGLMSCALGSIGHGYPIASSGQNMSYRKAAFLEVQGDQFIRHRVQGYDVLLLQLIRRLTNWRIAFSTSPGTFVVHPPARSWSALLSQRIRWASDAPTQIHMSPPFFVYMLITFVMNLLLAFSPLLVLAGGLSLFAAVGCWVGKILAEFGLFLRGTRFFGRQDLRRYFPFSTLTVPFYTILVGTLGPLGIFRWKGKTYRAGQSC